MSRSKRPNTIRLLDAADVDYSVSEYEVDGHLDAATVAEKIGAEPERVFKTLVTRGDATGVEVFCIPGNAELDLKKAAAVTGNKRVEMVRLDELTGLTGYVRGGCSPIGMKRQYRTHIDETAILYDSIYVSGGLRGVQLGIHPEDLARYIDAGFADVVK